MINKNKTIYFLLLSLLFVFPKENHASLRKAQQIFLQKNKSYLNYTLLGIQLLEDKIYYAAVPFFKEALVLKGDKRDSTFDQYVDFLIGKVGTAQFSSLPINYLRTSNSPAIRYILASNYHDKGQYKLALETLNKIPSDHFKYPHAQMLRAAILGFQKKYREAIKAYRNCMKEAKSQKSDADSEAEERTYQFIHDSCEVALPRFLYKLNKYDQSLKFYNKIPKTSYRWPNILIEEAWNLYYFKKYNHSIGKLLTYRSPIMSDYFFPEAEVLKTLNYVGLCLWKDAVETINYYNKIFTPTGKQLVKLLKRPDIPKSFFVKMALSKNHKAFKAFPVLKNIVSSIKQTPYYIRNIHVLEKLIGEFKKLRKVKRTYFIRVLMQNIKLGKERQEQMLDLHIKKELYFLANDIVRNSEELAIVNLEVFSRQKEDIYKEKVDPGLANRSRGNLKDIERQVDQYFWTFDGEFWADELGDYVLALESECPIEKKKKRFKRSKRRKRKL